MSESSEELVELHIAPPQPRPPGMIRMADLLWILMGILFVLSPFVGIVAKVAADVRLNREREPNPTAACSTAVSLGIGIAFIYAGYRLRRGTAPDTLLCSILSGLLGFLYLLVGVLGLVLSATASPRADPLLPVIAMIFGIVGLFVAAGLFLPAVLGLAGRSRYLRWRQAKYPPRRQRRRDIDPDDGDDRRPIQMARRMDRDS